MSSTEPGLPYLVEPPPGHITHEIILVHGFKSTQTNTPRHAQSREILESWVEECASASPLLDQVSLRVFAFDAPRILHSGGAPALGKATGDLCAGLEDVNSREPRSPFYLSPESQRDLEIFRDGSRFRGRSIIFVAHGLGAWVVKAALSRLDGQGSWLDPAALVFVDGLTSPCPPSTPVDVRTHGDVLGYLTRFSEVFGLDASGMDADDMCGLRDELRSVDCSFRTLTERRYGVCERREVEDLRRGGYRLIMWCPDVWMGDRPVLEFEEHPSSQTFSRRLGSILRRRSNRASRARKEQLQKLQDILLGKSLEEAVSMEGFDDYPDDLTDDGIDSVTETYLTSGSSGSSGSLGEGKGTGMLTT